MGEFLAMGGYAAYVWPAFGLTLLVLAVNVVAPIVKRRTLLKRLARIDKLTRAGKTARSNR